METQTEPSTQPSEERKQQALAAWAQVKDLEQMGEYLEKFPDFPVKLGVPDLGKHFSDQLAALDAADAEEARRNSSSLPRAKRQPRTEAEIQATVDEFEKKYPGKT